MTAFSPPRISDPAAFGRVAVLMGGTSFLVHYRLLRGKWKALGDNTEMGLWWGLIALFVFVIVVERMTKVEFAGYFSS